MNIKPLPYPKAQAALPAVNLKVVKKIGLVSVLVFFSVIFLLPFFWMLITAFKTPGDIMRFPPTWWPSPITFDNFPEAFNALPFGRFYINSFKIVVLHTLGTVISSALIGYGFARYNVPGSKLLFALLLATLALPEEVLLIPVFLLFKNLGWLNTILPLVVPAFFGNAFYIFLFRQFFRGIPNELLDAALIDGVNHLGAFWYVVMPLSFPVVAVVVVFNFISRWNDFFTPLIYLQEVNQMTVAVGLAYFRGETSTNWGPLMAASLVSIIPILIVFFIAQRYLVQGIATTGLKG
jgi:ABC-type glycerol-3-phosphate transport system permease component